MRRITSCIAAALLVCAFSASAASAKVRSRTITVGQDFSIAGKVVRAGTYRFSFDDEKNELTVSDRKTKEVLARAEARVDKWKKGVYPLLVLEGESSPLAFSGLSFDGKLVIRTAAAAAVGQ